MPLTGEERAFAHELLESSRDRLIGLIENLTPAQFIYRPGDGWSVAMIAEHLCIAEGALVRLLSSLPPDPAADVARDQDILRSTRSRSKRIPAPERVVPQGTFASMQQAIDKLLQVRERSLSWLRDPQADPRNHARAHPVLGVLDGYQWLLMTAAHSDRHAAQIEEIMATADFPKT